MTRFPVNHPNRVWVSYIRGESGLTSNDPYLLGTCPFEAAERRLCLASDGREQLPSKILDAGPEKKVQVGVPLLEAQVRRARALAYRDPNELTAALAIWDRVGAVPHQGRGRAERGLITGDLAETEAGLAILRSLAT